MAEFAQAHECQIHAYVFMTNHVHLLLTPRSSDALPGLMQTLGRLYVRYFNRRYGRTGTLWEGRYRAAPIDSEVYLLACSRYIELNPVRAGLVAHPRLYVWSSYHANGHGHRDALISPHPLYIALGGDASERQAAYRALFRDVLPKDFIADLRQSTNGGWAMGSESFRHQLANAMKRRVSPLPRGRRWPTEESN